MDVATDLILGHFARPEDYRKATQRVMHGVGEASFVEMPVVR